MAQTEIIQLFTKQHSTFFLQHAVAKIRQIRQLNSTPNPSDPGYARQKQNGKLWVRERLAALLDDASFVEIGSLTGKPTIDEKTGELKDFLPA